MKNMRSVSYAGTIHCGDRSRHIAVGSVVDFDEVLVEAAGGASALTLADALGDYCDTFEPEVRALPAAEARAEDASAVPGSPSSEFVPRAPRRLARRA